MNVLWSALFTGSRICFGSCRTLRRRALRRAAARRSPSAGPGGSGGRGAGRPGGTHWTGVEWTHWGLRMMLHNQLDGVAQLMTDPPDIHPMAKLEFGFRFGTGRFFLLFSHNVINCL